MTKKIKAVAAAFAFLFSATLAGCFAPYSPPDTCTVVFEKNEKTEMSESSFEVKRFDDLQVTVRTPKGLQITGTDYENYTLHLQPAADEFNYNNYTLTLHEVKYSSLVRFTVESAYSTNYSVNGEIINKTEVTPHLRLNTLAYSDDFAAENKVAIGWNTQADGGGEHVGFGSRIEHPVPESMDLYLEALPASDKSEFSYFAEDGGITVTGYSGGGDLVIPERIDGLPVKKIASGAFTDVTAENLVLPYSLDKIEYDAFNGLKVENFYVFDNLVKFGERSFKNYVIKTLHINAAQKPVYSTNYFAAFADKMDRLHSLKDSKKLIFFCGSSARFGYDSVAFADGFTDFEIVNLGVFAYANMQPKAQMVQNYLTQGDVILSSPELDAINMQFCADRKLYNWDFCMVEANYDLLALADLSEFTNIFGALAHYNEVRGDMPKSEYSASPNDYDEDGNAVTSPSYNVYGDYVVPRPDNFDNKEFSPGRKAYFNPDHIRQADWDGLNAVYAAFREKGARVYFTYSPRSTLGLSEDTTAESIRRLDEEMRAKLTAPVISDVNTAIMDPLYFYGTDNHLSTNGVKIHTAKVIADLKRAMENGL